jgi:hypothetical protein
MPELPSLLELDQTDVDASQAYLTERLQEVIPAAELRQGPLHDFLLLLMSPALTAFDELADDVRKSSSLLEISNDPAGADTLTVDRVLSNYEVVRQEGSPARGQAVVILNVFAPSNIAAGTLFSASGQQFITEKSFAGRIDEASVVTDTDRLITQISSDKFGYAIDLVAVEPGQAGEIRRNTRLEASVEIPNLDTSYARSDFSGGVDPDTNEELLNKLNEGRSPRDLAGQLSISALLRLGGTLPQSTFVSVIGYGAPEQHRYHGLFPVVGGARIDVYVRTAALPLQVQLTKTATLIRQIAAGGLWQFDIDRSDAPGFYDVIQIANPDEVTNTSGFGISEEIRGVNLVDPPGGYAPDIVGATEAAYSRFSTDVVRFIDEATDPSAAIGTTREISVGVRTLPQIDEAQTILSSSDNRPGGGDVVAKGAIPCDVNMNFKVRRRSTEEDPDFDAIRQSLATQINSMGFVGRLPASLIASIAHQHLTGSQALGQIDMRGVIRKPNGDKVYLHSDVCLEVPNLPDDSVTSRTVVFFLDPLAIGISSEVSNPAAI